jgi:predicted nucleic acid-binding protein
MKFLVDANVLSEVMRPKPEPKVLDWLSRNEAALAVNPVVLGEI